MLTYNKTTTSLPTTTLNDILPGTVFEGTVITACGTPKTGVFMRLYVGDHSGGGRSTVYAVGLTVRDTSRPDLPVQLLGCRQVLNYRPLKNPTITEGC